MAILFDLLNKIKVYAQTNVAYFKSILFALPCHYDELQTDLIFGLWVKL